MKQLKSFSMVDCSGLKEKPLIGFFPMFYSLGETIPLIKIAQSYMKLGGKAIFFSHSTQFEYMARNIGCKVVRLSKLWKNFGNQIDTLAAKNKLEQLTITPWTDQDFLEKLVKEEVEALKKTKIKLLISAFNLSSSISARYMKIPLIVLISGTSIPPYIRNNYATFPDNYENMLTMMIPKKIKDMIIRWYLLNNRMLVKNFNIIANKYNVKKFSNFNDIILGDYTFVCDDINFLGLKPTKNFPSENYIGPIFHRFVNKKHKNELDEDIINHIKKPNKSILVSMGSGGGKKLFLDILETLNNTEYKVVAISTDLLNDKELNKFDDNILIKKFVPSLKKLIKNVDLSIIHGGRGTVYNVAFSGKPSIGIPKFIEQQYNLDILVRHGSTIRLSNKYFNKRNLLNAINNIFDKYNIFLENAKDLAAKLSNQQGDKKAVRRIIEIYKFSCIDKNN